MHSACMKVFLPGRRLAPLGLGMALAAIASPAAATQSQAFYCIYEFDAPPAQPFLVPQGITELQVTVQGAHGGNPDHGADGGFGGQVQATFAVGPDGPLRPGQQLDVWVGCYGDTPIGYGWGGHKGVSRHGADGATGGGGSVVLDHVSEDELIVAGGGGGGGGASDDGKGGDGGPDPQPGQDGADSPGSGGCVDCQGVGENNGEDGGETDSDNGPGGGGGGGGGYIGGGGGAAGDEREDGGGGGGGAGTSFVAASATSVSQATSQLAGDGLVVISWNDAGLRDADGDGVPNPHDRCRSSYLDETVALGRRDALVRNDLDVDGCTLTDRIVRIAQRTATRTQFLHRARALVTQLREAGSITARERRALMRFVHQINIARLRRS